MLQINTSSKPQEVIVTNKHEAFAGTAYKDAVFSLTMKPVTQTKLSESRRNNTFIVKGSQVVDEAKPTMDVFVESVMSWEGIANEDGESIPCSDEMKRMIADQLVGFAASAVNACITESSKSAVIANEIEKN